VISLAQAHDSYHFSDTNILGRSWIGTYLNNVNADVIIDVKFEKLA
jgi:hypothetical protein